MNDRSIYEAPYSSPFDTRAMYHRCQDENATVVSRGGVSRWLCNCPGGPYFAIDIREGRDRKTREGART